MSVFRLPRGLLIAAFCVIALPLLATTKESARLAGPPLTIAHRGASAYAPEHTLAAYLLAIEQGADFVEQDLQLTSDDVLICLHDADLARTTNVASVFPDRATTRDIEGRRRRGWFAIDFSLAEIKRLDAGSWFNRSNPFAARPEYAAEKVPTLEEAIQAIRGQSGLYIELKQFEFYESLGRDLAKRVSRTLAAAGFEGPTKRDRVFIQSFSKACLLRLRASAPSYRRVQLLPMSDPASAGGSGSVSRELAREIATYAHGVGPSKDLIASRKDVEEFHRAGLVVHPYTFRGSTTAVLRARLDQAEGNGLTLRENLLAEMLRFIRFGVDGGFTDYPDLWREATRAR